jgi:serine protease Do
MFVVKDLLALGKVVRPFIGVQMHTITPSLRSDLKQIGHSIDEGVHVTVLPNTPAAQAGLHNGDVITHVNGIAVASDRDVLHLLERGGTFEFTVSRPPGTLVIPITPGSLEQVTRTV